MSLLTDREWRTKYTPDGGDFVGIFYVPALSCAVRYDRTTGYFRASALAPAARGIEGTVRNDGRMRLIIGCTLDEPEVTAIEKRASPARSSRPCCVRRSTTSTPKREPCSSCSPGWWRAASSP